MVKLPLKSHVSHGLEARHARDGRKRRVAGSLGDVHHDLPPAGGDDEQVEQGPGGVL